MKNKKHTTVPIADITATVKKAVNSALLQHKAVGNKIAFWRDGKIVYATPTFESTTSPENKTNKKPAQNTDIDQ